MCHIRGEDWFTAQPRVADCIDITQSTLHQLSNGRFVFLSKSVVYSLFLDRTFCPEEHLNHMGYEASMLDLSTIHLQLKQLKMVREGKEPDAAQPQSKAARKSKPRKAFKLAHSAKVRNVSGNAMLLPDLSSVAYCAVLALEDAGIFENEVVDTDSGEEHEDVHGGGGRGSVVSIPVSEGADIELDNSAKGMLLEALDLEVGEETLESDDEA